MSLPVWLLVLIRDLTYTDPEHISEIRKRAKYSLVNLLLTINQQIHIYCVYADSKRVGIWTY